MPPIRTRLSKVKDAVHDLLFVPKRSSLAVVSILLLVMEALLNVVIIHFVPYTEIDWVAYMQEVEPVIKNQTYNYSVLKGDTGPLVYPAGFVWFFSGLFHMTDNGTDVRMAQYYYAGFYLLLLALVFLIMIQTEKLPPYVLVFMSLMSYRIHSIFVLRLFNDPIAMIFLYAALNCFIIDYWSLGSVFYSLAVSIKMNVLLFAPALFFAYLATQGIAGTIVQLFICGSLQVVLALPFLYTNPIAYLSRSFDLGRVFLFEWTVNWRFLPEETFVSRPFHLFLLFLHVMILCFCLPKWWKMLNSYQTLRKHKQGPEYSSQLLILPLFMSNYIGLLCARSLHYQFYVWYFHQLHYLLWCTKYPTVIKLLTLGLIELCWNTFPSTVWSSGLLHICHLVLFLGLIFNLYSLSITVERREPKKKSK